MTWIKDNEGSYHNSDVFCQISVVVDDEDRYLIRAYSTNKGYVDLHWFKELDDANLYLKTMMACIV